MATRACPDGHKQAQRKVREQNVKLDRVLGTRDSCSSGHEQHRATGRLKYLSPLSLYTYDTAMNRKYAGNLV